MRVSRRKGGELVEGNAVGGMGLVEMARSNYEAAASHLEEAIALFERCDEDYLAPSLRAFVGTTLLARGETEQAERTFEEALASAYRLKHPALDYIALSNLAQTALARGDLEKTARMLGKGIALSRQTKDRANLAPSLSALAAVEPFEVGQSLPHPFSAQRMLCCERLVLPSTTSTTRIPPSRNVRWVRHVLFLAKPPSRRRWSEGGR